MKDRDAIIIGAGAAGLAAAWELSQAGGSAVVLEARQRIGGRVYTLHDRGSQVPTERGAEFVHGEAPDSFAIIRLAQVLVAQLPDSHYRLQNGKLATIPDFRGKSMPRERRSIAA